MGVFNYNDLRYVYFFIPRVSKKVKFMFSSLHNLNKFNGLLQRPTASQQHNRKQINAWQRNQRGLSTLWMPAVYCKKPQSGMGHNNFSPF